MIAHRDHLLLLSILLVQLVTSLMVNKFTYYGQAFKFNLADSWRADIQICQLKRFADTSHHPATSFGALAEVRLFMKL